MFYTFIKRYIVSHWRGEQGLMWSFVVNLVGLRLLVFGLQRLARPTEYRDYHDWAPIVLLLAFLLHGVLFVWQAVGVFRAGETFIKDRGAIAVHWGAQLGVIIAFWLTASYALNAWQMTIDVPDYVDHAAEWSRERESKYQLLAEPTGKLVIRGTLELGITKRLTALLAENVDINLIELSSAGGNIYEARGLAKLFRDKGLNTQVVDECSSACTTAFIGGIERRLRTGAKLGFHQYRVEADYTVLGADPKKEEERDQALYLAVGVNAAFVARMHAATPEGMWYPDANDLLSAGVVTTLVD